jgi:hypothetical protein
MKYVELSCQENQTVLPFISIEDENLYIITKRIAFKVEEENLGFVQFEDTESVELLKYSWNKSKKGIFILKVAFLCGNVTKDESVELLKYSFDVKFGEEKKTFSCSFTASNELATPSIQVLDSIFDVETDNVCIRALNDGKEKWNGKILYQFDDKEEWKELGDIPEIKSDETEDILVKAPKEYKDLLKKVEGIKFRFMDKYGTKFHGDSEIFSFDYFIPTPPTDINRAPLDKLSFLDKEGKKKICKNKDITDKYCYHHAMYKKLDKELGLNKNIVGKNNKKFLENIQNLKVKDLKNLEDFLYHREACDKLQTNVPCDHFRGYTDENGFYQRREVLKVDDEKVREDHRKLIKTLKTKIQELKTLE